MRVDETNAEVNRTTAKIQAALKFVIAFLGLMFFGAGAVYSQSGVSFSGDGVELPGGGYVIDRSLPFEFTVNNSLTIGDDVDWSVGEIERPGTPTGDNFFKFQAYGDMREIKASQSGSYDPESIAFRPYRLIELKFTGVQWGMEQDNDGWTNASFVEPIYLIDTTTEALPDDVIDFGSETVYAGQDFEISVSIPQELLNLLNPDNYYDGDIINWLELEVVPLGRLWGLYDVEDFSANAYSSEDITQSGRSEQTVLLRYPGTYEVRLQSRSGIIFAAKTLTVNAVELEIDPWRRDQPEPARLYPGWWPEIVFPGGPTINNQIPVPVEVRWRKIDPLAPDYEFDFDRLYPQLDFYTADSIPDYAVSSNRFLNSPAFSLPLEPDEDGVLRATTPAPFAGDQELWAVVRVRGDRDKVDSTLDLFVGDPVFVSVQAPPWSGEVQVAFQKRNDDLKLWELSGNRHLDGDVLDYTITMTGVYPNDFTESPMIDLAYRALETKNGLRRGSGYFYEQLSNSEYSWNRDTGVVTLEFELSAYELATGVDILVRNSCGYTGCFNTTYYRAPLPVPDGMRTPDWGDWLTYEIDDRGEGLIWPAGPYNPLRIEGAPETIPADISVDIAELEEPFVALQMAQIEIDVSNNGDGPLQGEALKVELGVRHPAERDLGNPASPVAAIVPAPNSDCRIDDKGLVLTCQLPELASDDTQTLYLSVRAPDIGSILEIRAEIDGAQDEEDFTAVGPVIVADSVPEGPAEIIKIIPINPQTGRDEFGEFVTRYPFGIDPQIVVSDKTRVLLILGKNLPELRSDVELGSSDPTIVYNFLESDQTFDRRELGYGDGGLVGKGLKRFFDMDDDPEILLEVLEESKFELILVEANFARGILPGVKSLQLNGASGDWVLDFANISIDLQFARLFTGDVANDDPNIEDQLSEAYFGENVRLVAYISPATIELPNISALITLPGGPIDQTEPLEVDLVRQQLNNGPAYVSAPLSLGGTLDGGRSLFADADLEEFTKVQASIDASYATAFLPRALGVQANLELWRSPGRGSSENLFFSAIEIAAACKGIALDRSDWRTKTFEEVEVLENTMVLNWMQSLEQNVHLGHLAGLVLLRDTWIDITTAREEELARIIADPHLLRRTYLSWRAIFDNPSLATPISPLFKIEVPNIGPAGVQPPMITFGEAVRFGQFIRQTAETGGMSREQTLAWVENVTRIAMQKLRDASAQARLEILSEDPCDVTEMAKIGKGMELVAELVAPKLVYFDTATDRWLPDRQARMWVASAVDLANAYEDQILATSTENEFFLASISIALMPIAALEGAYVGWIAIGASAAEFALQAAHDVNAYFESREELERALGLSLVIGDRRFDLAKARERTLGGLLANLALSSLSLGGDTLGFLHTRRVLRGAEIAKNIESMEAILALRGRQKTDFDAFYDDLIRIRTTKSVDDLSADQKRIFDMVMDSVPRGRPPVRPGAIADPFPASPGPHPTLILRSPEQVAAMQAAGKSPEGIFRFIPFHRSPDAPVRPLGYGANQAEQALLHGMEESLRKITNSYPVDSIEHMLARQNLSALQESSALIIFDKQLNNVGEGAYDAILERYTLTFNIEAFLNKKVRGVKWHFTAIYVHEAGHMIQFTHEVIDGVVVGRALREYDSMLRMSLIQILIDDIKGLARSLTPQQALEASLEYALETQWRSFDLADSLNPNFGDAQTYINGLTQFTYKEAVARAKLFFPDLNETQIIEAYLAAQKSAFHRYVSAASDNPLVMGANLNGKFSPMIVEARARLATLASLPS